MRQGSSKERTMQDDKKPAPKTAEKAQPEKQDAPRDAVPDHQRTDYTYSDWASI